MTYTINLTYGKFELPHAGHLKVFNKMYFWEPSAEQVIIASNRCDFDFLKGLLHFTPFFIRSNNIFKLVANIIDVYGWDIEINFFVGEDQKEFADALADAYEQVFPIIIKRDSSISATRIRQLLVECEDAFVRKAFMEDLVVHPNHARKLYAHALSFRK